MNRRKFILTGLIAAPAVIAVNHLMPVKLWKHDIADISIDISELADISIDISELKQMSYVTILNDSDGRIFKWSARHGLFLECVADGKESQPFSFSVRI